MTDADDPDRPATHKKPGIGPFDDYGFTRRRGMPGFSMDIKVEEPDDRHWLLQKRTLRGLWIAGLALLALTVVAELLFPIEPHFGFDDFVGFPAAFGFGVCVVMVLVSKALGLLLKRPEDYYRD